MIEDSYKKSNKFILNDDELDTLITEKFQRLQEQIEVRKEIDNKVGNVLYYLKMQESEKRNEVAAHYNAKRAESRINAMAITQ